MQVALPTVNKDAANSSDDEDKDVDEAEPMDTDENADPTAKGPAFDYSQLKRQTKVMTTAREREQLDEQFRNDIEARAATLARAAPNLKAVEQYDAVKVIACPLSHAHHAWLLFWLAKSVP